MNIKSILEELAIRTDYDASAACWYINPEWRVTTDNGANIWGTWETWEEANSACDEANRQGFKGLGLVMRGIAVCVNLQDESRFILAHSDDATPILSADIGDGETLRLLVEQFTKRDSATDFHRWAQQYAPIYCSDTSIVGE